MYSQWSRTLDSFLSDESGQGITEYGAILAFVAVLVALIFTTQSALKDSISAAFSTVVEQLNRVSKGS